MTRARRARAQPDGAARTAVDGNNWNAHPADGLPAYRRDVFSVGGVGSERALSAVSARKLTRGRSTDRPA
jgi:hypothetical protein